MVLVVYILLGTFLGILTFLLFIPKSLYVSVSLIITMSKKGITTTVQESKGKYTTPIPMAIVNLADIDKGNTFVWSLDGDKITIKVKR